MTGRKTSMPLQSPCQYIILPTDFSFPERISAPSKLSAPDSDGFLCDFWFLRRRRADSRNQIKAQRSGFDLKRKKERAKWSFHRKVETEWRKFLLTTRKGQKAPERHAVRRAFSCQLMVYKLKQYPAAETVSCGIADTSAQETGSALISPCFPPAPQKNTDTDKERGNARQRMYGFRPLYGI